MADSQNILGMNGIKKSFPGVAALEAAEEAHRRRAEAGELAQGTSLPVVAWEMPG